MVLKEVLWQLLKCRCWTSVVKEYVNEDCLLKCKCLKVFVKELKFIFCFKGLILTAVIKELIYNGFIKDRIFRELIIEGIFSGCY